MCKIYSKLFFNIYKNSEYKKKEINDEKTIKRVIKNMNHNSITGTAFIKP